MLAFIDQSSTHHHESVGEARGALDGNMREVREILEPLLSRAEGPPIFVPDTNAILYWPAIEDWELAGADRFEVLLVPSVTTEQDE